MASLLSPTRSHNGYSNEDDDDDDEVDIFSAKSQPKKSSNDKVHQVRKEVDEVVGIMKSNIETVLNRQEKLTIIEGKTENLLDGAMQFKQRSTQLKRRMCCNNCKLNILIAVVILVVLAVIIVPIAINLSSSSSDSAPPAPATSSAAVSATPAPISTAVLL